MKWKYHVDDPTTRVEATLRFRMKLVDQVSDNSVKNFTGNAKKRDTHWTITFILVILVLKEMIDKCTFQVLINTSNLPKNNGSLKKCSNQLFATLFMNSWRNTISSWRFVRRHVWWHHALQPNMYQKTTQAFQVFGMQYSCHQQDILKVFFPVKEDLIFVCV